MRGQRSATKGQRDGTTKVTKVNMAERTQILKFTNAPLPPTIYTLGGAGG